MIYLLYRLSGDFSYKVRHRNFHLQPHVRTSSTLPLFEFGKHTRTKPYIRNILDNNRNKMLLQEKVFKVCKYIVKRAWAQISPVGLQVVLTGDGLSVNLELKSRCPENARAFNISQRNFYTSFPTINMLAEFCNSTTKNSTFIKLETHSLD